MASILPLINEFPVGSLIIILCLIWAIERVIVTALNKNKPSIHYNCDCEEDDDGDGEDE
jgi:hypothetical protein